MWPMSENNAKNSKKTLKKYNILTGGCGVMVTVVGNVLGDTSSSPG